MKLRFFAAVSVGAVSSWLSLRLFVALSHLWPQSAIKDAAFAVLAVGALVTLWLATQLPTKLALLAMGAVAVAAPVALFVTLRVHDALTSGEIAWSCTRMGGLAFVAYGVSWLILSRVQRLLQK